MHTAGLVHRDVKPANIVFAEQEKRFKLIDLGACADLRAGTNYVPDEGIMDPSYCPPEQVSFSHAAHLQCPVPVYHMLSRFLLAIAAI